MGGSLGPRAVVRTLHRGKGKGINKNKGRDRGRGSGLSGGHRGIGRTRGTGRRIGGFLGRREKERVGRACLGEGGPGGARGLYIIDYFIVFFLIFYGDSWKVFREIFFGIMYRIHFQFTSCFCFFLRSSLFHHFSFKTYQNSSISSNLIKKLSINRTYKIQPQKPSKTSKSKTKRRYSRIFLQHRL